MERIENQERVREAFGRNRGQLGVIQQIDQRLNVVAAQHGAQQFCGSLAVDQR